MYVSLMHPQTHPRTPPVVAYACTSSRQVVVLARAPSHDPPLTRRGLPLSFLPATRRKEHRNVAAVVCGRLYPRVCLRVLSREDLRVGRARRVQE